MPTAPVVNTGVVQGPAGSVAETIRCPCLTWAMFVVIIQKRPSWCRRVGAKMPPLPADDGSVSWSARSRTLPICAQVSRSRLWKIGTPGRYSNEEFTR